MLSPCFANAVYRNCSGCVARNTVQSQQTFRLVGVACAGGFPVNDRAFSVELADGIDVCDKFVAVSDGARELDLQIVAGIPNPHSVILGKALQQ